MKISKPDIVPTRALCLQSALGQGQLGLVFESRPYDGVCRKTGLDFALLPARRWKNPQAISENVGKGSCLISDSEQSNWVCHGTSMSRLSDFNKTALK